MRETPEMTQTPGEPLPLPEPDTGLGVMVEERPETSSYDDGDHERFAHYYDQRRYDITRAMVEGTPITALCGKKWIPSRDATKYPVCPTCKEILDAIHPPEA